MKILAFTPYNTSGGAERVLTSLANEFAEKHEMVFVTFDNKKGFYPLNDQVKHIGMGLVTDGFSKIKKIMSIIHLEIKRLKTFNDILHTEKPDIVISFLFTTNIISAIACKKNNIPLVLSERNDPESYSKVKKTIMQLYYSTASAIVCQSDYMCEYAIKHYHLSKSVFIPNPLAKNQYTNSSYPEKAAKIISVGRLIPQKNHSMVIKAFSKIAQKYDSYKLYIYGEGPLRAVLNEQINQLNMQDRIFLPGVEKDVLIKNADAQLFILGSDFEGYPNVLVEAMANGILSISTDFPTKSARSIVRNGENGFLFPVGDEVSLVNLMKEILDAPEKYKAIEVNGTNITEITNIEYIAQKWIDLFEKCISY